MKSYNPSPLTALFAKIKPIVMVSMPLWLSYISAAPQINIFTNIAPPTLNLAQATQPKSTQRYKDYDRKLYEARSYLNAGRIAYQNKTFSAAISAFSQAIALDPKLLEAYEKRALSYVNRNQYSLALADMNAAIAIDPLYAKLYAYRGSIYRKQTNYLKAINDYSQWITLQPQNPRAYYYRGTAYLTLYDQQAAINDFTSTIFHQPTNDAAYYHRGVAQALKENHAAAIKDFSQARKLNPFLSSALLSRARSHAALANHRAALQDIADLLKKAPTTSAAYLVQGKSYQALGKLNQAKSSFQTALTYDPLSSFAYHNLAQLAILEQKPNQATLYYKLSLRILSDEIFNSPQNPQFYYDRARLYSILKNYPAAHRDYQMAYQLYKKISNTTLASAAKKKLTELAKISPQKK